MWLMGLGDEKRDDDPSEWRFRQNTQAKEIRTPNERPGKKPTATAAPGN
jgi:hypothetical protein